MIRKVSSLTNLKRSRYAKVMTLENEITGLKNDIQNLEDKIEEIEGSERRDIVIF